MSTSSHRGSHVEPDNYTDRAAERTRAGAPADRVGDITGEPPTNKATNTEVAAKMAELLEDLDFPASKDKILLYLNRKSPSMGNRINDVIEVARNNLDERVEYKSVYEIELGAGLVVKNAE